MSTILGFQASWNPCFPVFQQAADAHVDNDEVTELLNQRLGRLRTCFSDTRRAVAEARSVLLDQLKRRATAPPLEVDALQKLATAFRGVGTLLPSLASAAADVVQAAAQASTNADAKVASLTGDMNSLRDDLKRKWDLIESYERQMEDANQHMHLQWWEALIPGYGLYRGIDALTAYDNFKKARDRANGVVQQLQSLCIQTAQRAGVFAAQHHSRNRVLARGGAPALSVDVPEPHGPRRHEARIRNRRRLNSPPSMQGDWGASARSRRVPRLDQGPLESLSVGRKES